MSQIRSVLPGEPLSRVRRSRCGAGMDASMGRPPSKVSGVPRRNLRRFRWQLPAGHLRANGRHGNCAFDWRPARDLSMVLWPWTRSASRSRDGSSAAMTRRCRMRWRRFMNRRSVSGVFAYPAGSRWTSPAVGTSSSNASPRPAAGTTRAARPASPIRPRRAWTSWSAMRCGNPRPGRLSCAWISRGREPRAMADRAPMPECLAISKWHAVASAFTA